MKKCDCEHWETCMICYPQGFDEQGNRKPVEIPPTREELQAKVAELDRLLKTSFKYAQHHNDMKSEWNTHGWQSESLITELREIAHAIGETYRGN